MSNVGNHYHNDADNLKVFLGVQFDYQEIVRDHRAQATARQWRSFILTTPENHPIPAIVNPEI